MTEYDQSWFERMWYKRHDFLFQDLWVKESRMSLETFEFVVDLGQENISQFQFFSVLFLFCISTISFKNVICFQS